MTMSDPIADLLTRIRNGIHVRRKVVECPSSKLKSSLALLLKDEGYIRDVESDKDAKGFGILRLTLKYDVDGVSAITDITRTSKPGRRVYSKSKEIPLHRRGLGTTVVTTSKGVMTGRKAIELGVGGELLCTVF